MNQYLESFYSIRFGDCDPFGHLNNARYTDYFLNAREDHLKQYYDMDLASFYKKGIGWVVLQHAITYLRPASYNEKICICTGLLAASTEHLLVEMLMMNEKKSQLKALLHTTFVPVSLSSGKKEPHSTEFMEFIADKILPGHGLQKASVQERIEYWQKILTQTQPV